MITTDFNEHTAAHGKNWTKWLGHLIGKTHVSGLELGTWKGDSAEWMLTHIFTGFANNYECVDTFEGSEEHALAGIDCSALEQETREKLRKFSPFVKIHKTTSDAFLRSCPRLFDFIYVDAAHDSMNVLRDSVLAFDLLKPNGTMIFDDYQWTVMPNPLDCPKIGVDAFVSAYAKQIEVIGMGWQLAVRKVA